MMHEQETDKALAGALMSETERDQIHALEFLDKFVMGRKVNAHYGMSREMVALAMTLFAKQEAGRKASK